MALAAVLIALAFTALRPHPNAAGMMRDFEAYRAAGATWAHGGDAYSAQIAEYEPLLPRGALLPFVGVPVTLAWWSLFARLPHAVAGVAWTTVLSCALIALILSTAAVSHMRSPFDAACVAIAALAFTPITGGIALGQTAIVAAAACAAALCLRGRTLAFAACTFSAVALQPNIALGLLGVLRTWRAIAAFAGATIALYVSGTFFWGTGWPFTYARILAAHAAAERGSALQFTPAAIALGFGAPVPIATWIAIIFGCSAAAGAAYAAWRTRETPASFAAVSCALPFFSGFFHAQDLAIAFLPAILGLRSLAPRPRAVTIIAITAAGTNWLDMAQSPTALAQDVMLGCALIAASLAIVPKLDARVAAAACASLALLGFGAWIAATHPLPTWPDAMRGFRLPAHASAAQAWHAELSDTELLAVNAASAVLRCIALAGCAALLAVTIKTSNIDVHEIIERRNTVGVEVP
jgi:hypothetical protein